MNNFYASVECMLDPSLKGIPVAVCGSVAERHGIVLAKNYPAKAYGVQTGEAVWQAKNKCPGLRVVEPHYDEYVKYSVFAREIYSRFTDMVEPYGMDECWLDITGCEDAFGPPEKIADIIRETVKFELGLTISVGVSFNKIFAKLGSDLKKPDAVTVIGEEDFKEKIYGLPASDLLGVGRSTGRVLAGAAIRTIGELAAADPRMLVSKLGKNGLALWQFANGLDESRVARAGESPPVKSIGHGTTTVKDMENDGDVWPVILELTQDVGRRLRELEMRASGVVIHVRDSNLVCRQWQTPLSIPSTSAEVIAAAAFALFRAKYRWDLPVRSLTVRTVNLAPEGAAYMPGLWDDVELADRRERLGHCIDGIRRRFGKDSVRNCILCIPSSVPPEHAEIVMPTGMSC
jgi:DNA polymerase-4